MCSRQKFLILNPERGEGLYLPNGQTTLVTALDALSLLFCIFINTTAYHLADTSHHLILADLTISDLTNGKPFCMLPQMSYREKMFFNWPIPDSFSFIFGLF